MCDLFNGVNSMSVFRAYSMSTDCQPMCGPTQSKAHAHEHNLFQRQSGTGAEACCPRLPTPSHTALTQHKSRPQDSVAQRPSSQSAGTGGLHSAASFGPRPHAGVTVTLQTAPPHWTLHRSDSVRPMAACNPTGSPWHPPTETASRPLSKPMGGAQSKGRAFCPVSHSSVARRQGRTRHAVDDGSGACMKGTPVCLRNSGSANTALHANAGNLKKNYSARSASSKQEHTSLASDSVKPDERAALGNRVTASTSPMACMMWNGNDSQMQQDHRCGLSMQAREEEGFSRGSLGKHTTSAEADSKLGSRPPKPTPGRQTRVKRPPAHLAEDIASAQPASKAAKGGRGKACGPTAAQHGSAGSNLPAGEPQFLAKLQPFDGFKVSKCFMIAMHW